MQWWDEVKTARANIVIGMMLLAISLLERHLNGEDIVSALTSWSGSFLVIVGTGRVFVLGDD